MNTQLCFVTVVLWCCVQSGFGQGTIFTYQGYLADDGQPAVGSHDFRVRLWDAASEGNQVGADALVGPVSVSNGLFSAALDFGLASFNGDKRWLEIAVRPTPQGGAYTTLSPRTQLTSTPFALFAARAGSANLVQWSNVFGVPVGFADGLDNDTKYSAGTGLTLTPANSFNVNYAGSGTSSTAARSDHHHLGQAWSGAETNGLSVTTTLPQGNDPGSLIYGIAGLLGRHGTATGSGLVIPAGVWGDAGDGIGVLGTTARVNGAGVRGQHYPDHGSGEGVYGATASDNGRGMRGLAYAQTGTNYGVHGESISPDGVGVLGLNDNGVAIRAAGTGIIQSTAESSFFVPGSLLQKAYSESTTHMDFSGTGARVFGGATASDKVCVLPITTPAVLFGQGLTVKSVTVHYLCANGANNYITATTLLKMVDANTLATLATSTTDRTNRVPSIYVLTPTTGQTLNRASGHLTVNFTLHFENDVDWVQIAGARVDLAHQ